MILRFSFENFRSFRDLTQVSFVASRQKDEPSYRIPAAGTRHGVLPVLALFGANASGKSNILKAYEAFAGLIANSFANLKPKQPIPWTPWRLDRGEQANATRMEADFLVDGVRHNYGFRYSERGFQEEWLYQWPAGRRRLVFHRDHSEKQVWKLHDDERSGWTFATTRTRDNALFLSTALQFDHPLLARVAAVLTGALRGVDPAPPSHTPRFAEGSPLLEPGVLAAIQGVVQHSDLGICRLEPRPVEGVRLDLEPLQDVLKPEALEKLAQQMQSERRQFEIWMGHGEARDPWYLPPADESHGTRSLLQRLEQVVFHLRFGGLMLIDEFDAGLHPDLTAALVALYTTAETNPRGAQLVIATHDRGLMSALRRDEVYLVDKSPSGESTVRSAADFDGLRGRDDVRRVYEEGRLGGVPVLGDFAALLRVPEHGA